MDRTRTKSTESQYETLAARQINRSSLKHKRTPTMDEVMADLLEERSSIAQSTWNLKKAALVYFFAHIGRADLASALSQKTSQGTLKKSDKTSGKKKKSITEIEESKLRHALELRSETATSWARQLLAYTECILAIGLRPIELSQCELFMSEVEFLSAGGVSVDYTADYPMLRVKNAKATNGRSFGEFRHIDISNLPQKQMLMLEVAIKYGTNSIGPFGRVSSYKKYYDQLRWAMNNLVNKIMTGRGKKITLYSYRHQCIANLKTQFTVQEIAALVGHGNDITATEHYGQKRYGRDGSTSWIKPNPVDVAKVKPLLAKKLAAKQTSLTQKPSLG